MGIVFWGLGLRTLAPTFTPILFDMYVLREIQTPAPNTSRLPQSCSTCLCCERFKHWLPTQAVYSNLVRHVCVARDSNIGSQHKRLPQSCSTCMWCCERFKHWLPTRAFTPILFDMYVLRFKNRLPTRAFTPILFDMCVLREIQTPAPSTSRLPQSCSTCMCCERFKHWLPTQAVTPILFDMYVLREIQTLPPVTGVYPDLVRHLGGLLSAISSLLSPKGTQLMLMMLALIPPQAHDALFDFARNSFLAGCLHAMICGAFC